ncbi:glycosyltransferase family 4 protein [Variovorax defluvii]
MQPGRCAFLLPGDPETRTGGYTYDRHIVAGLRALGWEVELQSLGAGYPSPDATALARAARVVEALPDGALAVVDGLAFGVLPDLAGQHAQRLCWVALVHHPLALETGLHADAQRLLFDSERRALAHARGVIVTSPSTARALAAFGVEAGRIAVVEPGTAPAPLSAGSGGEGLSLLCVATVTPRKGHALLVEALAGLKDRPWVLHCAGSLSMDGACASALRKAIEHHGLQARVLLHGEQDEAGLRALYAKADAFVLPSFHEGYGMALAEALAHGLPVVSTRAGAIPDTVPAEAGLLVAPGEVPALREALRLLMDDGASRARLAAGARTARARLPDWARSSERFGAALSAFARQPKARP